jgi:predicted transcriptional regulator
MAISNSTKAVKIYLRVAQAEALEKIADEEDRTVTGLVRIAVDQYLATRAAQEEAAA